MSSVVLFRLLKKVRNDFAWVIFFIQYIFHFSKDVVFLSSNSENAKSSPLINFASYGGLQIAILSN